MKKFAMIILVAVLAFSLVACGTTTTNTPDNSTVANTPETISTVEPTPEATSADNEPDNNVSVEENLLTVDITLPASYFDKQDMSAFDAVAYAKENGYEKAVLNSDGSLTITMSKSKHSEILTSMESNLEESFNNFVGSEDTPYIKAITHTKDFRAVTIDVEKEAYESVFFEMTPFTIGISVGFYQMFLEDGYKVEIIVKDEASGDVLLDTIYPDALNQQDN